MITTRGPPRPLPGMIMTTDSMVFFTPSLKSAPKFRKMSKRQDFIVSVLLFAHPNRVCVSLVRDFILYNEIEPARLYCYTETPKHLGFPGSELRKLES